MPSLHVRNVTGWRGGKEQREPVCLVTTTTIADRNLALTLLEVATN